MLLGLRCLLLFLLRGLRLCVRSAHGISRGGCLVFMCLKTFVRGSWCAHGFCEPSSVAAGLQYASFLVSCNIFAASALTAVFSNVL
jgi:hypothetical protein